MLFVSDLPGYPSYTFFLLWALLLTRSLLGRLPRPSPPPEIRLLRPVKRFHGREQVETNSFSRSSARFFNDPDSAERRLSAKAASQARLWMPHVHTTVVHRTGRGVSLCRPLPTAAKWTQQKKRAYKRLSKQSLFTNYFFNTSRLQPTY